MCWQRHGVIGLLCILGAAEMSAQGATINLGTAGNAASWKVTGAGATNAVPFQTSANHAGEISLTSNALKGGTFVTGGSLAAFNGFWYADIPFSLPANAVNVSLSFDSFYGNDRAVLQLNNIAIGNMDHLDGTGSGVMAFPPGPPDVPFTITGVTSGTATTGFILGGSNTLRMIINNTGVTPITAPTATFASTGDATDAYVNATVTYDVPEPGMVAPLLLGAIGALACGRRRRLA